MATPADPNNIEVITTSFTKGLNKDSDPEPWAIFPMWFWQNDANPTHEQK